MPGRRLNSHESNLLEFWENPSPAFPRPLLRQIRIEGEPGLRGIRRLLVPIKFPFAVLCGRNGVGKSTVLALAALSAKPPDTWEVYWGNTRPRTRPGVRARYRYSDFFHRTPGDPPSDGLRLGWISIDRGNETERTEECRNGRWRAVQNIARHPDRIAQPTREVDFLPMSRVLAAGEFGSVRSAFAGPAAPSVQALNGDALEKLSFIMGKRYTTAEVRTLRGLGLPNCQAEARYSGFDMGGGECSLIAILSRLQSLPTGALAVVEELELGLHAEAQERLVRTLIEMCRQRRIQLICSTHSEVVLDQLPRQARILLRKHDAEHEAINDVSTRCAMHEMSGSPRPELMIYTEDQFAATLVEEALAGPIRARVAIRDIGSNATLARQAVAHLRTAGHLQALSCFDGDCNEKDVNRWISDERADRRDLEPHRLILPGNGLNPESWILGQLEHREYVEAFSRELNCEPRLASSHLVAMRVQLDHHDAGHTLSERTGLEPKVARRHLIRSVARVHPALNELRDRVAALLDRPRQT